jgi:hypothetical protein
MSVPEIQLEKVPQIPDGFQPTVAIRASSPEGLAAVTKAMCEARPKFGVIKKSAENPFYKDAKGKNRKYADISEIIGNTADQLAEAGIYIFQAPFINNDRTAGIVTLISHISGGFIEMTISGCPADQKLKEGGSRYDAQTIGIAFTYLARYAETRALNLATEDDDGNGLVNQDKPSEQPKRFGQGGQFIGGLPNRPVGLAQQDFSTPEIPTKSVIPLMEKPVQVPNADADGCPLSDADLPKPDSPLPTPLEKTAYGTRLKALKQDSRLLKEYLQKKAGCLYTQITKKQFDEIIPVLEDALKAGTIGELIKG